MVELFHEADFWEAIAFIIAIGFALKPVGRAITGGLDRRGERIRAELEEARRLRDEAQELLASYQRKQREAEREAEGLIAHAREEAERVARRAAADLEAQLARRRQQAMDRIGQAEADAVRQVRAAAVELALKATRKLITQKIDEDRQAKLVDDAIEEIGKRLH
jgi:F-type H+-transporting ATPase subunit b